MNDEIDRFDQIMFDVTKKMIDQINQYNKQDDDYIKNGLIICGKCNTPKQKIETLFEKEWIIPVACECKKEYLKQEEEKKAAEKARQRILNLRQKGIADEVCNDWTFQNDKGYNPKATQTAKRYVDKWAEVKEKNIGLLFYGDVGTGKSFIAYCIANALIDKGIPVLATNLPKLISKIQSSYGDQTEIINQVERAELLLLDDLGVERNSDFALEKVFEIIDTRIKSGKPLIVTTNLSPNDFKTNELKFKRIFDRIIGVTVPVQITGESIRQKQNKDRTKIASEILGL